MRRKIHYVTLKTVMQIRETIAPLSSHKMHTWTFVDYIPVSVTDKRVCCNRGLPNGRQEKIWGEQVHGHNARVRNSPLHLPLFRLSGQWWRKEEFQPSVWQWCNSSYCDNTRQLADNSLSRWIACWHHSLQSNGDLVVTWLQTIQLHNSCTEVSFSSCCACPSLTNCEG